MKSLLRKLLTDQQYSLLKKLKNRFLPYPSLQLIQAALWVIIWILAILPKRCKIAIKSKINVTAKLDYPHSKILMSIDSDFEYRVRLKSCAKEPEIVVWMETFFNENQVFYDVGANVGAYSLVASSIFPDNMQIFAFEPAFQNYSQLCRNLKLNDCGEHVIPLQIALSDRTTIDIFNYRNLVSGSAVHALGEAVNHLGQPFLPVLGQAVLSYRADEFIEQFQVPVPHHIKIDVDGIEYSVLQGLTNTLDNPTVKSLFLELNEERGQKDLLLQFLKDKGFAIHSDHGNNHIFTRSL